MYRPWSILLAASFVGACGSDDATTTSTTSTGGSGTGTGVGGAGGSGAAGGMGGEGGTSEYVPTPEDIGSMALAPVPTGEQILFNDWSVPDRIKSMAPDGSGVVDVFQTFRVWSMGVSQAGDRVAFACGDPEQEAHYGLTIGDAIQHTWLYDMDSETIEVAAYGNLNDECHHFSPSDDAVYVCRRYDFTPDGMFSGYRVGRIELPSFDFTWVAAREADFTLNPTVSPDGNTLWWTRIALPSQARTIETVALPDGGPTVWRSDAHRPALSPDGQQIVFADINDMSRLYVTDVNGTGTPVQVSDVAGTKPTWSPDGTRIAYVLWDDAAVCAHVEIVMADGSTATTPDRIRDCSQTGEQITQLAWFVRP